MNKAKKFEHLAKRKWYIQGFNCTPNLIFFGMTSGMVGCNRKVGYGYSAMIHAFKNDYNEYHYGVDDLRKIGENIVDNFKKNRNYIKSLIKKDNSDFKKIFKFFNYLDTINVENELTGKLIELYQQTSNYYSQLLDRSHIIEGFALTYDFKIKKGIEEHLLKKKTNKKPSEVFNIVTMPDKSSFMLEEGRDLLRILAEIQNNKKLSGIFKSENAEIILSRLKDFKKFYSMLESHRQKYYWIKNFYAGSKILTLNNFVSELKIMLKKGMYAKKLISRQEGKLKNSLKEKKSMLKKLNFPEELRDLIEISNQIGAWQDDRKMHILKTIHYLDLLLVEIGKRHSLKEEFVRYLLPYEVREKDLSKIDNKFLENRKKGCIIIAEGNAKVLVTEVLTGNKYRQYLNLLKKYKKEEFKELSGMCASQGSAAGKVRVCKSHGDIVNFRNGEVLVASMTRPEYLPAIKKAAAIVTDEGGITSHAAIVARELGIPCIIGTKTATKQLKNGNLVEVKANHGVVILLEK